MSALIAIVSLRAQGRAAERCEDGSRVAFKSIAGTLLSVTGRFGRDSNHPRFPF